MAVERGSGGALIRLEGNRRAVIEGCGGVVDYDEERVLVRMGRRIVTVTGKRLKLLQRKERGKIWQKLILHMHMRRGLILSLARPTS